MNRLTSLLTVCALGTAASASDLNLSIESGGSNAVTVSPGEIVTYNVVGELSDSLNEGLALFSIDLSMPGVTLTPAGAPTSTNMQNFDSPLGLSNPAGFGGTQTGADLKQIGGMQNTLLNSFAPAPSGSVITGIAQPGSAETLLTGQVTMPTQSGTYTLDASNVLANVIRQGETGLVTWFVDEAGTGTVTPLTVTVESLFADTNSLSLSAGGTVTLTLDGGASNAGNFYFMGASASGTTPGFVVDGLVLPLNFDAFTTYTINNPNGAPYSGKIGFLDGVGLGTTTITVPAGSFPSMAGLTINHAYIVHDGVSTVMTSNAEPLTLLP